MSHETEIRPFRVDMPDEAIADLARLWADRDRQEDACDLLRPVLTQFTEGFDTADLRAATRLLAQLTPQQKQPTLTHANDA